MRFAHSDEDVDKLCGSQKKAKALLMMIVSMSKYIPTRHIEIQIIGDGHGGAVHLYEH